MELSHSSRRRSQTNRSMPDRAQVAQKWGAQAEAGSSQARSAEHPGTQPKASQAQARGHDSTAR
eukprot:10595471-Alexandrium_andersonii.AAC.1